MRVELAMTDRTAEGARVREENVKQGQVNLRREPKEVELREAVTMRSVRSQVSSDVKSKERKCIQHEKIPKDREKRG
jgi:hypothetical protein